MKEKFRFIQQARTISQYDEHDFSDSEFENAIERAKKHLGAKDAVQDVASANWYTDIKLNEALFWTTLLFTKVATGVLDHQDFSSGAIEKGELLAKSDDDVTTWYRNYNEALQALNSGSSSRMTDHVTPQRTSVEGNRQYE